MPTSPAPATRGLGLALGAAVLVRLVTLAVWSSDLLVDRDAYLGIAANIARGVGYCQPESTVPTAYRPPLYPMLIGLLSVVLPTGVAVATINLVAGLATVMGAAVLARRWWPALDWPPVVAAGIVACDPLLLRYVAQPMTESLFAALVIWTLVGIEYLCDTDRTPRLMAAGLIAGLTIVCRPTLLPFLGLVGLGLLVAVVRRQLAWQRLVCWSLAAGLPVGVWGVRNMLVFGVGLLTTTHGGYTLHLANNPVFYREVARQPWGAVWERASLLQWQAENARRMAADLGPQAGEFQEDRWHAQQAWQAIATDRVGCAWAMLYRQRSFWSLAPRGETTLPGGVALVVAGWYALLFAGAVAGLMRVPLRSRRIALILVGTIAAVHLMYWTDTRMRAPLHPVLAVLAAGAVSSLWQRVRSTDSRTEQPASSA